MFFFLFFFQAVLSQNHVTMQFRMISFLNNENRLADGSKCETGPYYECDTYFIFCLSTDPQPK